MQASGVVGVTRHVHDDVHVGETEGCRVGWLGARGRRARSASAPSVHQRLEPMKAVPSVWPSGAKTSTTSTRPGPAVPATGTDGMVSD